MIELIRGLGCRTSIVEIAKNAIFATVRTSGVCQAGLVVYMDWDDYYADGGGVRSCGIM